MRIGITMRVVETEAYREPRDAISHDCIRWLEGLGHTPLPIPNSLAAPAAFVREFGLEGVVLSSGNDVAPRPGADETAQERDRTETALLEAAAGQRLPVFGICRGMHVINRHFGGEIVADIKTECPGAAGHVASEHGVDLDDAFGRIAGAQRIVTNSFHNQAVRAAGLGAGIKAFARCTSDGLVEGIVHAELPFLAVQWHPERPNPASPFDQAIVQRLFGELSFWR